MAGVGTPTPAVQTLADHSSVKQPGTFPAGTAIRVCKVRGRSTDPGHDGVARLEIAVTAIEPLDPKEPLCYSSSSSIGLRFRFFDFLFGLSEFRFRMPLIK